MRLLITTDTVGGVWTYTTQLAAGLLQKGVAIALITVGRAPSATQVQWLHRMTALYHRNFRWDVCTTPLEWMEDNHGAYRDAEPLLLQVAHDFQPDLLHSNQFCFGALPLRIPILVVAHSDVLSWAAACRGRALPPSAWLDRYCAVVAAGLRGAGMVAAPTHWMLHALSDHFSLPARTEVIPNGRTLDPPTLQVERASQSVSAGRFWDEAKNLQLLTRVRSPWPVLVAGETSYRSTTKPEARGAYTELGLLSENELLTLFRRSAIYLCTSSYEPFGLAPLEAALCGCAVLANDIPSLREVWDEGALYFGDAASLSDLLSALALDPQRLAAAQRASFRKAQQYPAPSMAAKYLALYHSMVSPEAAARVA